MFFGDFFCRLILYKGTGLEVNAGRCGVELAFFLKTEFSIRVVAAGTKSGPSHLMNPISVHTE